MTQTITISIMTLLLTAVLAGDAMSAAPVCGDVNDSNTITSTDALLVLKKSVLQPIVLNCSDYDDQYTGCQQSLTMCQNAPKCGDGSVQIGEDCEAGKLQGATCASFGYEGGKLACAPGCDFDTSGCYATRFDASGLTIIDHETGLEWEKKQAPVGDPAFAKPHETSIRFTYCVPGAVYPTCLNPNHPFDGTGATEFLARLNGGADGVCYAGHCDWRLPTIDELEDIFIPDPGCVTPPCPIDDVFLPMSDGAYLSSSVNTPYGTNYIWAIIPDTGVRGAYYRRTELPIRAVRRAS